MMHVQTEHKPEFPVEPSSNNNQACNKKTIALDHSVNTVFGTCVQTGSSSSPEVEPLLYIIKRNVHSVIVCTCSDRRDQYVKNVTRAEETDGMKELQGKWLKNTFTVLHNVPVLCKMEGRAAPNISKLAK